MRVLLFTGKGGVGKTTTAAATAVQSARRGHKTLVLSTDPAHSLADAFGVELEHEPTEIEPGLYGQQVDTQRAFEDSWREVQHYLRDVLEAGGVDPLEAEELTVLPGADEVLALLELRAQAESGRWDVLVVDCAPTAETLRLLALPEALSWYMERVFPRERRLVRSLRPVLSQLAGLPMPPDKVFAAVERLHAELSEVRALLVDPSTTSVRLVLTPEAVVVAEARRTLTSLSLYGYRVDGVVANRVMPFGSQDPWMQGWVAAQRKQLDGIATSFGTTPVWLSSYQPNEPVGVEPLAALAAQLYADVDPLAVNETEDPLVVERVSSDEFVLSVALPHADKRTVDLVRKGDELVLTVGSHRRVLALPSVLRRCVVDGAGLRDGALRVRFRPDPDVWMRA
ncbi:MAG: arsenite/tail-anchored protein-transporting ATPase [Frankiaceae bacterium]|jgi:arsenite-transporting ATPase|nr:arsenite/tail-anchored protein-transporting ATPase [Frankiaceae bacterium]